MLMLSTCVSTIAEPATETDNTVRLNDLEEREAVGLVRWHQLHELRCLGFVAALHLVSFCMS